MLIEALEIALVVAIALLLGVALVAFIFMVVSLVRYIRGGADRD